LTALPSISIMLQASTPGYGRRTTATCQRSKALELPIRPSQANPIADPKHEKLGRPPVETVGPRRPRPRMGCTQLQRRQSSLRAVHSGFLCGALGRRPPPLLVRGRALYSLSRMEQIPATGSRIATAGCRHLWPDNHHDLFADAADIGLAAG
jgi:hypothetical protein